MKKSLLFLALITLTVGSIQAQNSLALLSNETEMTNITIEKNDVVKRRIEENKFRKVEKQVIEQLQKEVEFPELAYEFGIEGTVLLQFTFDGEIRDLKVTKSLGAGCDKAAIKALNNFPKLYKELGGENVEAIQITLPFKFEM